MKNVALITGASSGIGKEMAKYHASLGGDVVLVARNEDALNKLKQELNEQYSIEAVLIVADLSQAEAAENIFKATESAGINVDILINNAGFGGHGKFYQRDLLTDQQMMQVNMVALVSLTHMYLRGMVKRNSGRILHVASVAAFMPGPLQAVYYATKSFVVSFSQAIAKELDGTNVTSTALCPGAVDTGFVKAGNLQGVTVWDKAKSPQSVAKFGYDAMMKGKLVKVNEFKLDLLVNWVIPFLPRKLVLRLSQDAMEKH